VEIHQNDIQVGGKSSRVRPRIIMRPAAVAAAHFSDLSCRGVIILLPIMITESC
jgi:hypothetical protein